MKSLKKVLKDKIETLEYLQNGMNRISGASVTVQIHEYSECLDTVLAKITLNYDCDGKKEIYDDCEYRLSSLIKKGAGK